MSTNTDMLAKYIEAEMAVLKGQSFSMNGRTLTRTNLSEIRAGRKEWEVKVQAEKAKSQGGSSQFSQVKF